MAIKTFYKIVVTIFLVAVGAIFLPLLFTEASEPVTDADVVGMGFTADQNGITSITYHYEWND
jgi:cell division septation protein DedD